MLGHLKPTFCKSSANNKENYWEFYCSVCASLRHKHDLAYSLLLNNEITLILSAFQDDFENLKEIRTACPAKVFLAKNHAFAHPAIDIAAHLSVVLGWIKALDWHTDKPHIAKKILLNRLDKKVKKILPVLSSEAQTTIANYAHITRENEQDFTVIRQQSAYLAEMLVKEIGFAIGASQESIDSLVVIFGKAGELIAIADHLIDLDKDQQYQQYNPILVEADLYKIPLSQAYWQLKTAYYEIRHALFGLLPQMNQAFVEAFKQSLYRLDKQIDKNLPACMHTEEARQMVGKMQTAKGTMPQISPLMPEASGCCDEACAGACLGACCQACAQGCCDSACDSCCSGDCCSSNSNSPEAQQRREARRQERERKKQEKEARKQAAKDKKKAEKTKEDKKESPDDAY